METKEELKKEDDMPEEFKQPVPESLMARKKRWDRIFYSLPRHTDVASYVERMRKAWELLREEEYVDATRSS